MGDDGREIVEARLPAERGADLRESATIRAGSPSRRGAISTLKSAPDTRLTASITSQHRIAVAVAAIERRRGAAGAQIGERVGMGAGRGR